MTLVSFDNHPDWDIRPPKWCCGSWMNRALDLPQVEQHRGLGLREFRVLGLAPGLGEPPRRALRPAGGASVGGWTLRRPTGRGRASILRDNWRERFERFAAGLAGRALYVTVDIDGLRAEDAVTNWENGRFRAEDVAWALDELSRHATIVAGDLCGARSDAAYARRTQRFASETDHPELPPFDRPEAPRINARTFRDDLAAADGTPLRALNSPKRASRPR